MHLPDKLLLGNLCIPGQQGRWDILVENDTIASVEPAHATPLLSFDNAQVFPGLINSHDHLDFDLFPMLGNKVYADYREWGTDINARNSDLIAAVLKVPRSLRTRWGLYKNLLNGFTTVVNHGARLDTGTEELITVFQDCRSLHSLSGEKHWKWKLNRWRAGLIAVHIGEGANQAVVDEINRLRRWNLFGQKIVGIHGIAMQEKQANAFHALVWCPDSNYFLYDRTARIDLLKRRVPILFGTDSTLSARWNSWDQLRLARKERMLTDKELISAVAKEAAQAWGMPRLGELTTGSQADLVIAKKQKGTKGMDAFYAINPEDLLLVLHRGSVRLFDQSLAVPLMAAGLDRQGFSKVHFPRTENDKYVQGDLPGLMASIRSYYPGAEFPFTSTP